MHLRLSDLDHTHDSKCYLTHEGRNEDSDDALIDVANQLGMYKRELVSWAKSYRSWMFMEALEGSDLDISDFFNEFDAMECA